MPSARIVGFFLLLLTAGCAVTGCVGPREPRQAGATQGGATAVEPPPAATRSSTETAKLEVRPEQPPAPGSTGQGPTETVAPAAKADAPAIKAEPSATRMDAPAAKTPAKAPASSAPAPMKPPPLDLPLLEKRLKDTNAIGVFTKLTLKNQIDDLLNRFRAHYGGRAKTSLAELRQPFDLLILKVLALVQDGDPSLARAIADSREAIWSILADPAKFKAL